MALQIGIVGLPNVGKSTLFNALTKTQGAAVANYPFCTIDPNVGVVEVQDQRLHELARVSKSEKVVPAIVEFVDIAGLVKGASTGEGLGNQFLSHIRNVDAIVEVVRCFEDDNVLHVHGQVHPQNDVEIIEAELIIADLETVDKRIPNVEKKTRAGDKDAAREVEMLGKLKSHLEQGKIAHSFEVAEDVLPAFRELHLLTAKPFLYGLNLSEAQIKSMTPETLRTFLPKVDPKLLVPISAQIEAELVGLDETDAKEFLKDLNLERSTLQGLVEQAYALLGLQSYFTSGEKESRAWTIHQGDTAPKAAGVIHTDFEKGFIKADVVDWKDFVDLGGWTAAREKGKVRMEGKEYVMREGDTVLFKFNV